jgi:hypothetical protein
MLPAPMLLRPGPIPIGIAWSFEVKWDGFRALVSTLDGLRVRSRRGWDMTPLLPGEPLDASASLLAERPGRSRTDATKGGTMHSTIDVWTYREGVPLDASPRDVVGYGVEARDGSIGKVDDATYEVGSSYVVVDTGPWIFGKKVMLPAGVIRDVDHDEEKVFVNRTKDQIKDAPEFDDSLVRDEEYRGRLGSYYGPGGAGYRDWDEA